MWVTIDLYLQTYTTLVADKRIGNTSNRCELRRIGQEDGGHVTSIGRTPALAAAWRSSKNEHGIECRNPNAMAKTNAEALSTVDALNAARGCCGHASAQTLAPCSVWILVDSSHSVDLQEVLSRPARSAAGPIV